MATQIRHTKRQVELYHRQIKRITLVPLQRMIIDKLSKAPNLTANWEHAIDSSFNDTEYNDLLHEKSETTANNHIESVASWQKKKAVTQFQELFAMDLLPLLNDQKTRSELDPIVSENIGLIKSIPKDLHAKVLNHFDRILTTDGFDEQKILQMLTQRFDVSDSRAKLIARDQTGKTVGALAGIRQQQANVAHFQWHTSEDERVRPEHQALDKQIFAWNNPPSIGIPSQPINCRCVGIPYIMGISD